jgi:hypothetical protein
VKNGQVPLQNVEYIFEIPQSFSDLFGKNIKEISCSGCTSLKILPNWPLVTKVDCYGCKSL